MKAKAWVAIVALAAVVPGMPGCTEGFFERQDRKTVERQLHLPEGVRYLSFQSYPRSWGWFGREGLWIRAELEVTESAFAAYVADLDNPAVWQPVAFESYSPSQGESYSADALRWTDLPLPDLVRSRYRERCAMRPDLLDAVHGKYYCSVITALQTAPLRKGNQSPHHRQATRWRPVGRSCAEIADPPSSATVWVLAILDFGTRRMSVHVEFSG